MPTAPPRVCARCRQPAPASQPCSRCDQTWIRKPDSWPTGAGHRRWRNLRAAIFRAEPLSRHCGRLATTVDHVIPLSQGGRPL